VTDAVMRVGQATAPGVGGRATTATAYGGFGASHLLGLTDGSPTPGAAAAVAQAAATTLLRTFRDARAGLDARARLTQAVTVAVAAARRARMEGGATKGQQGPAVEVAAVVVEAQEIWWARLGDAALWVVRGEVASPMESYAPEASVPCEFPDADGGSLTMTLLGARLRLNAGDRLVLATGATARNLPHDFGALSRASSPQLAAQRLLQAAGAPGTDAAMAVQVLEVFETGDRGKGEGERRSWRRVLGLLRRGPTPPADDEGPLSDDALDAREAELLRSMLELPDPAEAARALGRHLGEVAKLAPDDGLDRVARCLVAQRSPHAVAALAHLLAARPRARVRDFLLAVLPRMVG
jgi:hypothetical protein